MFSQSQSIPSLEFCSDFDSRSSWTSASASASASGSVSLPASSPLPFSSSSPTPTSPLPLPLSLHLPSWSTEQQRAIALVLAGSNVILTGPAGCGKSSVTEFIRSKLTERGRRVAMAATTGTAAYNIGGKTLHSFLHVSPKIDEQTKV